MIAHRRFSTIRPPLRQPALVVGFLAAVAVAYGAAPSTPKDAAAAKPALRVLRDECMGCHKPGKAKGGLLLTTREKMLAGGDNGPAVVPGKAADSLLYQLVLEEGDPHMPPKKQLSAAAAGALAAWINSGAVWDATVFDELPTVKPVALAPVPQSYRPVLALSLSPDEKRLAVATGNAISIYDVTKPDRPRVGVLTGHLEAVQSLAWTADGTQIVSGGFRQLRVWDAANSKEVAVISSGLVGPVTALVTSASGGIAFAADGDSGGAGFIHRVDLASKKITATWKAHDDTIYALRLSADGKRLASGAADKLAKIWQAADGRLVSVYEGHTSHVLGVAFNKDATQIATAGADREVKVWDVASREQDVSLGDKKIAFSGLAWTPDGKVLAAVTDKGGGSLYSELKKHTGEQRSATAKQTKLSNVPATLYNIALTADAKTVFAGGDDGRVYVWDASGKEISRIEPPQ